MKRSMTTLLVGVLLFVLWSDAVSADDWPQWLGSQRDSVWRETGILDRLPEGGPKILWRQKVGAGFAGPAVAGGKVFITDFVTSDEMPKPSAGRRDRLKGTERVLCLAADTGKTLWTYKYERSYFISYPAGPRATPTVDGDRVYVLGAEGNLACLRVADGSCIWSKELTKEYDFKTPQWGFAGHPLVDGEKLICLVGGEGSIAVALDKLTGKELWKALSARGPGYCPPTIIEAGGARQLLIWHPESLNSLDPETGKVYWSQALEPSWEMSIAVPRREGPYLFVGAIVMKSMLLKLNENSPAAEVLWYGKKGQGIGPTFSTPFIEGGHMYGVDMGGELRCVELASGKQVWSTYEATTQDRRKNNASVFLVKHEDRFFLLNDQGVLIIARLTPKGYEEISRAKILEPTGFAEGRNVVWSHPAFANRCCFARNDKEIVCVSLAAD